MLSKKVDGSGLSGVLLEPDLMSDGSLKGVLTGRNYNRAMYCHKSMLESIEGLLLQKYAILNNKGENFLVSQTLV